MQPGQCDGDGGRRNLGLPSIHRVLGLEGSFGSQPEIGAHRIERTEVIRGGLSMPYQHSLHCYPQKSRSITARALHPVRN